MRLLRRVSRRCNLIAPQARFPRRLRFQVVAKKTHVTVQIAVQLRSSGGCRNRCKIPANRNESSSLPAPAAAFKAILDLLVDPLYR
jgi:hypothetical protein